MKLISLTANKKSFHTVKFNKNGLSFIVGKQKFPSEKDQGKTYNGVGKSLLIYLVNFCLGSESSKALEKSLPDWKFTLDFEQNGKIFSVTRSVKNQNVVILNGIEYKIDSYKEYMEQNIFSVYEPIPRLKFRPLMNRFIRPLKQSYVRYDEIYGRSTDYENLLVIGYLLGLDISLIIKKHELKTNYDDIKNMEKELSENPILKEYFTREFNIDIEKKDLEERIKILEKDLEDFKIAENYQDIESKANIIKRELNEYRNLLILIENSIENINKSIRLKPDIKPEKIKSLYSEIKKHLPELIENELDSVYDFHNKLIETRIKRLTKEKNQLFEQHNDLENKINVKSQELNSMLEFLDTHGALDEFVETNKFLSSLKVKLNRVEEYNRILENYRYKKQDTKLEFSKQDKKTEEYLFDSKEHLNNLVDQFRVFSRTFYNNKPGGLTVKNNTGLNQVRFDISAEIQDDTSDGINEVKIFCFDMTLLTLKQNHNVEFLFHDSRLFSNMDPRQRVTSFTLAKQYTNEKNMQYIATVNQDQIDSIREWLGEDEFNNLFNENTIILELTDEDDTEKLLGIQVDLKYDK